MRTVMHLGFNARIVPKKILPSSTIPRDESLSINVSDSIGVSDEANATVERVPHTYINKNDLEKGIPAFKLFHTTGLATSGSAARRLIEQGGAYVNGSRLESFEDLITINDFNNRELLLRAGKKRYHKVITN